MGQNFAVDDFAGSLWNSGMNHAHSSELEGVAEREIDWLVNPHYHGFEIDWGLPVMTGNVAETQSAMYPVGACNSSGIDLKVETTKVDLEIVQHLFVHSFSVANGHCCVLKTRY
jgi:hypothetical protein